MYSLRNLLYPSTTAPPELANITYHLQFTGGSADSSSRFCHGTASNRIFLSTNGIVTLRYGWTIIGIYTLIHPALLHQLQFQLPFKYQRQASPHGVPFLWNGYNQLPSTSIHLTISTDNLTCLPGDSEVDDVLKELTSYVSLSLHGYIHVMHGCTIIICMLEYGK